MIKPWEDLRTHSNQWDRRTIMLSAYIEPNSKVIEFGAGRMILKNYLPKGCKYQPADLVERCKGCLVIDLNHIPYPELGKYDVAFFSGVLEYVYNVPGVIENVSKYVNQIIVSYCGKDYQTATACQNNDWKLISEREFIRAFTKVGFELCNTDQWGSQRIYNFRRA